MSEKTEKLGNIVRKVRKDRKVKKVRTDRTVRKCTNDRKDRKARTDIPEYLSTPGNYVFI